MFERQQNLKAYKGDKTRKLLAEHQGLIRSYILSLTADVHAANDVLQETNLVICRKEADFEPGTSFKAWACRIAYFEVLRHRKKLTRDKLVFDDGLVDMLAQDAEKETAFYISRKHALAHCLTKLSETNRKLVLQRYFEGHGIEAIAEQSGSRANAVSQKLFRVRKVLQKCIKQSLVDNRRA